MESGFRAAFEAADEELLQHLESASEDGKTLTGAGATASVLLVDDEQIAVANVGDSSCVLVRNGRQHTLTTAHRVYGGCGAATRGASWRSLHLLCCFAPALLHCSTITGLGRWTRSTRLHARAPL